MAASPADVWALIEKLGSRDDLLWPSDSWPRTRFDRALQDLSDKGRIKELQLIEVQVYGAVAAKVDAEHAGDRAAIAVFRAA